MADKAEKKDEKKETEDLRGQIRQLQEQMKDLQEQMRKAAKETSLPDKEQQIDRIGEEIGERMEELGHRLSDRGKELGEYISMVVGDVMRGVDKTLRKTIFVGPKGKFIRAGDKNIIISKEGEEPISPVPPEEAQRLLSPLASAERIKLLYLLADSPQYHQDLMNESGLAPGTLPHHLKQLEEAGYITQERVRGRYLITIPGRMALKLAEYLHNQMRTTEQKEAKSEEEEREED
ncbi:MAG: ArsR family transcriptional regulator [Candidatus Hodarchaeota archaeon]